MKPLIRPRAGQIRSETRPGIGHMVRWTEWGDPDNPKVLLCAHGLSRNARDFDYLATTMAHRYRVICPDYPGRGESDWLSNPNDYHNEQYLRDTFVILDALSFDQLDWVGTSMGGLIGMAVASMPENPISKMVINDVGPFIPADALNLIGDYLGIHPEFVDQDAAIEYFKTVYASFGVLDEEHYQHFVTHGVCAAKNGNGYVLNYDPAIIDQFVGTEFGDIDIWEVWDKITIPVLIIRGKKSSLLLPQTMEQMKHRNGKAESIEFDDCAHAPSLMVEEQIRAISDWL